MKKLLLLIILFTVKTTFAQNLIDNPGFEIGPTSTQVGLPPGYCPSWQYGCQTQFPFSSTQWCTPDLYDINGTMSCWLSNVLLPRQNGSTNKRYSHMFPSSTYQSGESIKGDINQSLSTLHSYEVSCYVSRKWNYLPPNSNSTWVQNPNLKLEFVLRKDNDCSIEKIIYTSSDITNYCYYNDGCEGYQSTDWRLKTGQFNLTQSDVNVGYNKLEIRIKGLGMLLNSVFVDDVSLIEIDKVSADFHFTNPNQTNITMNSVYGPQAVTQICQTFPNTCVTIDGSASQNEDRYHIEITPWDLNSWSPSSLPLFDGWVCIGCSAGPKNLCDLTNLYGSSFQPNIVYKVTLGVGIPWDDETHFIIIKPTSTISAISDQTICSGDAAIFNITTSNWPVQVFDGTTLVGSFNSNPIILNPNSTSTYEFVPSNKHYCAERQRATVIVKECPPDPNPCFNFVEPYNIATIETAYGPMPIAEYCFPANVPIDISCSQSAEGYHLRVDEIDPGTWQLGPSLYSNWLPNNLTPPQTAGIVDLTSLVNNQFIINQVYFVDLVVGPGWNTGFAQLFRIIDCDAQPRDESSINNTRNSLKIYPNPTTGQTSIQLDEIASGEMIVYSLDGKVLISQTFIEVSRLEVDLGAFENGTYIVKLNTLTDSFVEKISKQ